MTTEALGTLWHGVPMLSVQVLGEIKFGSGGTFSKLAELESSISKLLILFFN